MSARRRSNSGCTPAPRTRRGRRRPPTDGGTPSRPRAATAMWRVAPPRFAAHAMIGACSCRPHRLRVVRDSRVIARPGEGQLGRVLLVPTHKTPYPPASTAVAVRRGVMLWSRWSARRTQSIRCDHQSPRACSRVLQELDHPGRASPPPDRRAPVELTIQSSARARGSREWTLPPRWSRIPAPASWAMAA